MSPAGGAGGGGGGAGAAGSGWGGAADSSMAVWPAQVHSGKAVSSLARLFLKTLSFWGVVVVTAGWWAGAVAWIWVSEMTVKLAPRPPMPTLVVPVKPVPVMTTVSPPSWVAAPLGA